MNAIVKHDDKQNKLETYRNLATIAVKSGCYPKMSIEQAINLMLSAADLGVSPMKALNGSFHVINGKICMAGHLISDRIRAAGHSVKVVEHSREKCVIIGVRRDNEDSYKSEFDIEDAKLAGLLGSDTWRKYPKDMLYNRAIARLGRILFSDVVGASYSEEEGDDIAGIKPEERIAKDPDTDIIIEPLPQPEKEITSPQRGLLESLLDQLNDAGYEKFVCNKYKLENIFDLPKDKFNLVIDEIKSLIKGKSNADIK